MCSIAVSTLVVEWIEILQAVLDLWVKDVSTLVVEWIEIMVHHYEHPGYEVSTLVVEWIEIPNGTIL